MGLLYSRLAINTLDKLSIFFKNNSQISSLTQICTSEHLCSLHHMFVSLLLTHSISVYSHWVISTRVSSFISMSYSLCTIIIIFCCVQIFVYSPPSPVNLVMFSTFGLFLHILLEIPVTYVRCNPQSGIRIRMGNPRNFLLSGFLVDPFLFKRSSLSTVITNSRTNASLHN
jgi:hypothetical protein